MEHKNKRLVADLRDGKFLTIVFISEKLALFVISGESAPHLRNLTIEEGIQIVEAAGYSYEIDEIDSNTVRWWK